MAQRIKMGEGIALYEGPVFNSKPCEKNKNKNKQSAKTIKKKKKHLRSIVCVVLAFSEQIKS